MAEDTAVMEVHSTDYEVTLSIEDGEVNADVEPLTTEVEQAIQSYTDEHPNIRGWRMGNGDVEVGGRIVLTCEIQEGKPGTTHIGGIGQRTDAANNLRDAGIALDLQYFEERSTGEDGFLLVADIVERDSLDRL